MYAPAPTSEPPQSDVTPVSPGFSVAAIVLGAISLIFFPILFGLAGVILAAVAVGRKEKFGYAALGVAATGTILGMLLGMLAWVNIFELP